MTKIKQLTAKGFKSFASRTDLVFGDGFNVIIGPNGAGKSNVCDALTFVLGKSSAKSMRAEKSANLIYNGGKGKNPSKEAEVSIVFSNEDKEFPFEGKEVVVSRIVKQNGNSVYKLNGKTMSKQEIVDVLSVARIDPDGHNVILQGDIVHFMEMKPEARRELVEEIAGISVYDDKKEKALHELEKVQEKLTEADIILAEREAHLRELKKERDDAQRYKELQEKIKDNKATYLHLQIKAKEEKRNEIQSKIDEQEKKLQIIDNKIKEIKELIHGKRGEIREINKEIEEKGEKEQIILRNEIAKLKEEVITNNSRLDVIENELRKIKGRREQLKQALVDTSNKIKELNEQKKNLSNNVREVYLEEEKLFSKIKKYKESHGLDKFGDIGQKLQAMDKEFEDKRSELAKLQEEEQSLLRERDKLDIRLNQIEETILKFKDKEGGDKLKQLRLQFKEVTKQLGKSVNEDSAYSAQLGNARNKLYSVQEELARLNVRQAGIREAVAGDRSIKKVMELKGKGVYGTVAELGEVQKEYALALEVAAGTRINSIVVKDDLIAAKCIQILKDNKLGVATFLPLNKLKEKAIDGKELKKEKGVYGFAIDLVKHDAKFSNVFKYVFGNTMVVDDLSTARRIGIGRIRMVTLEGDLIDISGAMVGGYRRDSASKFQQKEVSGRMLELEEETDRLRKIVFSLEAKKSENEASLISLREQKAGLEGEIIRLEKSLGVDGDISALKDERDKLIESIKGIDKEIKQIVGEKNNIGKGIIDLKGEIDLLRDKISKNPEIVKGLNALESEKNSLREKSINIKSEIKQIDHQVSLLNEENTKIDQIIKDQEKEKESFAAEKNNLAVSILNKQRELREKQKLEQEFYGKFKSLVIKRNKLEEEIIKREEGIVAEEERARAFESRMHEFSIVKAKFVAEMEGLQREFEEYKDGKIRRSISIEELKKEIDEYDKAIRSIGSVNMRALEVYEGIKKEYDVLLEKSESIRREKEDVLQAMEEIEQHKIGAFMKTFKELEKNFCEIFSTLNTKGEAQLLLENKESPLEGGLDIRVRLIGNKFLDIRSLSGGEKTMAALAFIFAIQEFNPAPFYLLDEVDAALDKHNSEKLSKLIWKYSKGAQYIVVSHNDNVITEAEQIYGVSMQDGISKVVSLKV